MNALILSGAFFLSISAGAASAAPAAGENYCLRSEMVVRSLELTTQKPCARISAVDIQNASKLYLKFKNEDKMEATDLAGLDFRAATYVFLGGDIDKFAPKIPPGFFLPLRSVPAKALYAYQLTRLPESTLAEIFSSMPNITTLTWANSTSLTLHDPETFGYLQQLETLNLGLGNGPYGGFGCFESIASAPFRGLRRLKKLNVQSFCLQPDSDGKPLRIFDGLTALEELSFHHICPLNSPCGDPVFSLFREEAVFSSLANLRKLELFLGPADENGKVSLIPEFKPGNFLPLKKLRWLSTAGFSYSGDSAPAGVLAGLEHVKFKDLQICTKQVCKTYSNP